MCLQFYIFIVLYMNAKELTMSLISFQHFAVVTYFFWRSCIFIFTTILMSYNNTFFFLKCYIHIKKQKKSRIVFSTFAVLIKIIKIVSLPLYVFSSLLS